MPIAIQDDGARLKIIQDSLPARNIYKSEIIEVTLIKTNIVKINLGLGALYNIFIPFTEVQDPATDTPEHLVDAINMMIAPYTTNAGSATEARQLEQIAATDNVSSQVQYVSSLVASMLDMLFYEPSMVDTSGAGVVYQGFAPPGTLPTAAGWAIKRIKQDNGVETTMWANGGKAFTHRWNDRETVSYS